MDSFLCCITLTCFYVILSGAVSQGAVNSDPFMTRKQSTPFLESSQHKRFKREESGGEEHTPAPAPPYYCINNHCANGATCNNGSTGYSCTCAPSWTGYHCNVDINQCDSSPCQHGGTCTDKWKNYSCTCIPGITGRNCEININECASNPCQNNATCHYDINWYYCECTLRTYGVNCETNICHPTPADVVFVLDSSESLLESGFRKELEFVANFSDNVIIGPRDFQLSVITFSSDAHIEFFLNQYTDNATLKEAVMNINYKPGATYTDKGLEAVKTVFSAGHGIERRVNDTHADRFVYLLTDGMSYDRQKTKEVAQDIKDNCGVQLIAVGIQSPLRMVFYAQLVEISSQHDDGLNVYSVDEFNSLYKLLKLVTNVHTALCQT